ncbi:MAG: translation initiation factor IF-2, partial [Bdellovibrionales bacterium]
MSGPKVFEFAKTVGMETLGLMDKLREWNIPVKNHMAELDESMVQLIRTKLEEAREAKKTPAKKAATRKAAAPKAAADKEIEKPKSKVEKPAAKKGEATTNGASKTTKVATKGKVAAGKVIRRKAGEAPPKSEEAEAPEAASVAEAITPPETKTADAQAPVVPETVAPVAEVAPVVAAPQAPVPPAPKIPLRPVKREVVPGTGKAPLSQPSNIIGRIDLNRAQSQRPRPPGSGGQHGGANAGPQVRGTMRAGFQANPNPFIVPEEPGRRDDRRKKTGGFAPRPGGIDESATQKEEEVEVFSATEFRKREIVFQPKKKKTVLARQGMKTAITTPKASKRVVEIYDTIKVADFAKEMGIKAATIIAHLMKQGMMVTQNDSLDFDTAALIAPEFQHEVVNLKKTSADATSAVAFGDLEAERIIRAPVVTVMGHVDHGKTSLLDAIRKADVASGEAGGITQHIGAYQVKLENDQVVTFIDTPGHAAFTAMRARGANVTDIVILVVAADDGVMNQTIEAISHAKAAGVPIIVAVNKMDKPGAQPERIKQQLTEYELVAEEWGGTTVFMPVSALKKTGVKELLEHVLVQAEVLELKANPKRSGTGVVIESKLERGRGIVATMLVKDGTVRLGQSISAGVTFGRVRAMFNDRGQSLKEAGPSMPIEVLGLNETPMAGDTFDICENETAAQELSAHRKEARTKALETPKAKVSLEEL